MRAGRWLFSEDTRILAAIYLEVIGVSTLRASASGSPTAKSNFAPHRLVFLAQPRAAILTILKWVRTVPKYLT